MSGTTRRMKRLYHQLVHRWDEADDIIVFRDGLHVAVWKATSEDDVTNFVSLGMSDRVMKDADYRCEVTLGHRGKLAARDRRRLAAFVANVAEYPFDWDRKLDVWERLVNPGDIPLFPCCQHLLFAPSFAEKPFNRFESPDDDVKLLYAIPITAREGHILKEHGRESFLDHVDEKAIDLFAPRPPSAR